MSVISKVSPLATKNFPIMLPVSGVRFSTAKAGIKSGDGDDVTLIILDPATEIAGLFTSSLMQSAPVIDCQSKIGIEGHGKGAAIIINSGNANAFTGRQGENAVREIVDSLSTIADLPVQRIFSSSTGVIGELLEYEKIITVLNSLVDSVEVSKIGDAA